MRGSCFHAHVEEDRTYILFDSSVVKKQQLETHTPSRSHKSLLIAELGRYLQLESAH